MGHANTDTADVTVYVTDDVSQTDFCFSMPQNPTIRRVKLQIAMKNTIRDASESKVLMVTNPGDCYELTQNRRKLENDTEIKDISQNGQLLLALHVIVGTNTNL